MLFLPPVATHACLPGGVSSAPSLAFLCKGLAQGLPVACLRPLERVRVATADPRCPRVSPQLPRGSSGGSAPPSRARSWTCWRRSSPRLATLTSSCARRWRSRSICQSPESRCARLGLKSQGRGSGACPREPPEDGLEWGRAYRLGSFSQTPPSAGRGPGRGAKLKELP